MSSEEIDVKKLLKEAKSYIVSNKNNEIDIKRGIQILKRIIKHDAKNVWAYILYGCAVQRLEGREIEALKAFDVASKLNPNAPETWRGFVALSNFLKETGEHSKLLNAYSNLLRLAADDKWNIIFEEAKESFSKPTDVITLLSQSVDSDPLSNGLKHKISCKIISLSVFDDPTAYEKYSDVINLAFKGFSRSLDFYDRPIFCLRAVQLMMKLKKHSDVTDFLAYTLKSYGLQTYKTVNLVDIIIEISLYNVESAREFVSLVSGRVKDHCSKNFGLPQSKLAMSIVCWFESDYLFTREILELRSFSGDRSALRLLLKFLVYVMDFDGVIFLLTRLKSLFSSEISNQKKVEILLHLIRALSCCNETKCLVLALKLGIKLKKSYRLQPYELSELFFCLTHACIGLQKDKMFYYLRKLLPLCSNREQVNYLLALIEGKARSVPPDSLFWAHNLMLDISSSLIKGDLSHVSKNCKILVAMEKRLPDPFVILGLICESRDQVKSAYSCYDKALSLRTHDCYILWLLSNLLLRNGKVEEALEVMKSTALGLFGKWHPSAERACKVAGLIHSIRNENSEALDRFRQAHKISHNSREYLEYIADVYKQMKMLSSAENYYLRLISDEVNDLHSMLSFTFTVKLSLNFSGYFNNSIKCINCVPSPNANLRDYENILAYILCNFVNIYSSVSFSQLPQKLRFHFDSNLKKLCTKELLKVKQLYSQCEITRKSDNSKPCEYLISIYCYLESHLIAAVKFHRRREIEMANKLFQFCCEGIFKAFSLYGMHHVSFWKLLGDVFSNSSLTNKTLKVPLSFNPHHEHFFYMNVSINEWASINNQSQLLAAVKCYAMAAKILPANSSRLYEMYYDMSVAFFRLSLSCLNPSVKYHFLKESLSAVLKGYCLCPMEDDVWIFVNLISAITSVLGMKRNFFSELLSSRNRQEDIFMNNKATWLLKLSNVEEALQVYETVRIETNGSYCSPWVGQLVIMLEQNDKETRKRLLFLMRHLGSHPLLKWLFGYHLYQNQKRYTSNFQKGLNDLIRGVFGNSLNESSPGRLTLLGYVLEMAGDTSAAYRAYVLALDAARYVTDDATLDILLQNVARISNKCHLAVDLIRNISDNDNQTLGMLKFLLRHIFKSAVEPKVFNCLLINLKNVILSDSRHVQSFPRLVLLILHILKKKHAHDLNGALISSVIQSDLSAFNFFSKDTVKKSLCSLPPGKLSSIMRLIKNFIFSHNLLSADSHNVKLMIPESGSTVTSDNIKLVHVDEHRCNIVVSCVPNKLISPLAQSQPARSSNVSHQESLYSSKLVKLRKIFPLPLSSGAEFNQRRENIKAFHALQRKTLRPKLDCSFSILTPPMKSEPLNDDSHQVKEVFESHGCHSVCRNLVSLLYKNLKNKDLSNAAKLCFICLDSKCIKCVSPKELLTIVIYLATSLKNSKLLQKALHLYPDNTALWKCLILFTRVR